MLYSNNQIALYLNLASERIKADGGSLKYLTGQPEPKLEGSGNGQETQILFVRDALWIANNDDNDSKLQQALLNKLGIGTPEALIEHVATYQGRVFKRRTAGGGKAYVPPNSPAETLLYELSTLDAVGNAKLDGLGKIVPPEYPADITVFPKSASNPKYTLTPPGGGGGKPPVAGIVFVMGNYEGTGKDVNEHAEQKLLAALSRVPDNITGTLALYGCKRQCAVCESVFEQALPRLKSSYRYLNCRAHSDKQVKGYQAQAHPSNIKALDVNKYFPL